MIDYNSITRAVEALYSHMHQRDLSMDLAIATTEDRNSDVEDGLAYIEAAKKHQKHAESMMEYIAVRFKQDLDTMPGNLKDIYYGHK